jgi:hypothetical protein
MARGIRVPLAGEVHPVSNRKLDFVFSLKMAQESSILLIKAHQGLQFVQGGL